MKLLESIIADFLEQGAILALATIVERTGSVPRQPGARMLVTPDLGVNGSIGGGLAEAEVLEAAFAVFRGKDSRLLHFDMTAVAPEADLICGGVVDILVEQLLPAQASLFREAALCREKASFGIWTIDVTDPARPVREFYNDPRPLPFPVLNRVQNNTPGCVEYGPRKIYVEPLLYPGIVILCGGGHVSLAVGALAKQVGFEVEVIDDRAEFVSWERFPFACAVHKVETFTHLAQNCAFGPQHYVIIATRGHRHDRECLIQVIGAPVRYIGMLGSRRKRESIYAFLRGEGFTEADCNRVHCPIGLDIGAETPEEIAVSDRKSVV